MSEFPHGSQSNATRALQREASGVRGSCVRGDRGVRARDRRSQPGLIRYRETVCFEARLRLPCASSRKFINSRWMSSSVPGQPVTGLPFGRGAEQASVSGRDIDSGKRKGPCCQSNGTSPTSCFTATEASVVAEVDGDGRAEILMVSKGADPSANGCKCPNGSNQSTTVSGIAWTPSPDPRKAYRGLVLVGAKANSWVGTRTLLGGDAHAMERAHLPRIQDP